MRAKRTGFTLYADYVDQISDLNLKQRGILFTAILEYASGNDPEITDPLVKMAYGFIRAQMEAEAEHRKEVAAARAEAGKRGGRPPIKKKDAVKRVEKKEPKLEEKAEAIPYKEIIDYLNEKTGSAYRASSKATQEHIRARYREGYTLEDFKTVIIKKSEEWAGTEMQQYLRPETLFGTKFESYLNTKVTKKKGNSFHNFTQRETDYDALVAQINGF